MHDTETRIFHNLTSLVHTPRANIRKARSYTGARWTWTRSLVPKVSLEQWRLFYDNHSITCCPESWLLAHHSFYPAAPVCVYYWHECAVFGRVVFLVINFRVNRQQEAICNMWELWGRASKDVVRLCSNSEMSIFVLMHVMGLLPLLYVRKRADSLSFENVSEILFNCWKLY